MRRLIARMLEHANFITLEASNGLQGLQLMQEQQPDIVTCDISMPVMDGYEFLRTAKKTPVVKDIPIILITALGQQDDPDKALEMGADAYLTKPFSSSHLVELIRAQLDKRAKNP
jgi:CheY-like chemotaxis protein